MATFGVTDSGFSLKRLSDILTDTNSYLARIVDPQTGERLNLTDENDPIINVRDADADALGAAWEMLQLAYNQFDPLKATGAGLSGLVQLNGITRHAGSASTVPVQVTGDAGVYVSAGKQIATYDGLLKFSLPEWTFGVSGTATVLATCTEEGPLEANIGAVTKILTPTPGWSSVTNAVAATIGTYPETDTQLRARQQLSTETTGASVVDAMYGALANIPGVSWVRVYQNNTLTTDGRGIPGKSFAPVIRGGDDAAIAAVLFIKSPGLGEFYGSTTVNLSDAQGIPYALKFTRPSQIPIYVDISLTVVNSSLWPSDGATQIKNAIIEYSEFGAPGLGIASGFERTGYAPGQNVYASELYTAINSVPGAQVTSLQIGIVDPPASQTATIAWNEIAVFDPDNITVTVTI